MKRPNIILIITDQQRYETIAALGFPYVTTPHLDRMVNEGVAFSQCHVTSPSCGPSRASLFTGYFPHNSGALRNNDSWPRTWVQDLNDSGYHCVNIGKMHADPYYKDHGFHERFVVENKQRREGEFGWSGNPHIFNDEWDKALDLNGIDRPEKSFYREWPDKRERQGAYEWKFPDHLHPDVFVGDLALRWLDKSAYGNDAYEGLEDQPLFLEIGFPGPHPPFDPIESYTKEYMEKDLPIIPVTQEEMDAQPETLQSLRKRMTKRFADSIDFDPHASDESRKRQRAYYLANVTMIDEKVGQIFEKLDENGLLENSVVLFTSDHGDCMGDHGLVEKWNMYDSSVRVPLVVWSPERYQGGHCVEALTQWFDIGPTILELAGLNPPEKMEAESLIPFLEDSADAEEREYVFSEHAQDLMLQDVDHSLMIRSKRFKLVEYIGKNDGQLFDLENDPDELKDLWDAPNYSEEKAILRQALSEWFVTSTTRTTGWWKNPAAKPK
ncbi:MAG: sulfatase-like hydrolase/transferase [Opitutae bacterium]|nr:sulfatase-like hydrolase/transferase [Opitutae bacterium]